MSDVAEEAGVIFGPYEILRPLGVGGMAETSIAMRRGPGGFEQQVCLKRILPAFTTDPKFVEMFLAEARIAARLRHNNVVQVFDFGEHQGSFYMALELVDGLDLRGFIRRMAQREEEIDVELVRHVAYELLVALAYAHELKIDGEPAGLVHRDVSPSNVLLSVHGELKLADFGIAKPTLTSNATQTGSIKGKIPYMAPEQAEGRRVDQRTDLFAVGVIVYEMMAGRRPFDGPTETATLLNITRGEYTPIDVVARECPPALSELVRKLLAHDADDRFASASVAADFMVDSALVPGPVATRRLSRIVKRLRAAPVETLDTPSPVGADASGVSAKEARGSAEPYSANPPASAPAIAAPGVAGHPPDPSSNAITHPKAGNPAEGTAVIVPRPGVPFLWIGIGLGAMFLIGFVGVGAVIFGGDTTEVEPIELAPSTEREGMDSPTTDAPTAPTMATPATSAMTETPVEPTTETPLMVAPPTPPTIAPSMVQATTMVTPPPEMQEPAADTRPGRIRVSVIPWASSITLDMRPIQANQFQSVRPGRHRITAVSAMRTQHRTVNVQPNGEHRVTIRFEAE